MPTKTIPIFLPGDKVAWVMAGPTRELPSDRRLIRCAAEIPVPMDRIAFDIATKDFQPFDPALLRAKLPAIMDALAGGDRLYVGCMGGSGRTGTLLAILAAQHPGMEGVSAITYIRQVYREAAVETQHQEAQVITMAHAWEFAPEGPLDLTGYEVVNSSARPGLLSRMGERFLAFHEWLGSHSRKRG